MIQKQETLEESMKKCIFDYRLNTYLPDILNEDTYYSNNLKEKTIDLLELITSLVSLDVFTYFNLALIDFKYQDELATLSLLCKENKEHYKELNLFLIHQIYSLKDLLLQYELFEALANLDKFININNTINLK